MPSHRNRYNNIHKILDIGYVLESYHCPSSHSNSKFNILSLNKNEIVFILDVSKNHWLDIVTINETKNISRGWFPQNYVKLINDTRIKNIHFTKLSNLLSSSNSSSSSSSSILNSDPIDPLSSWSFINPNDQNITNNITDQQDNQNIEKSSMTSLDLLKDYKLCTRTQIEKEFYNKFTLSNDKSYKLPILWQIMENDQNNGIGDSRHKLIYYNSDLKIYCYEFPVLIHSSWEREKFDSIDTLKSSKLYLSNKKLFISNPNDSISLLDIFEHLLYSSSLLKRVLLTKDKLKTAKYLKSISLTVTYIFLIIRHFEPFFISSVKKRIRQLLKSILKYSSLIKLNANIHCSKDLLQNISNSNFIMGNKSQFTNRNSQGTFNGSNTIPYFTNFNGYECDRNDSLTTNDTTVSNNTLIQPLSSYNPRYYNRNTSVSSIYSKNSTIDLSPRRTSTTFINEKIAQRIEDLMFSHIDNLQNSTQLLFYFINNCVKLPDEGALSLPQLFPRFFIDSYGNGNWSNLIVNYLTTTDSVTTMSTVDGLFSKQSTVSLSSITSDGLVDIENPVSPSIPHFLKEPIQQASNEDTASVSNPNSKMSKNKSSTTPSSNINTSGRASSNPPTSTSPSLSYLAKNPDALFNKSASVTDVCKHRDLVTKKREKLRNRIYPLNRDTLTMMMTKKEAVYNDMLDYMICTTDSEPNINKILKVYTELNEHNVNLYIIENLDLTFFANLKNVIENGDHNDETIKLLNYTANNIVFLINSYLEVKQWFHDISIELTMVTQEVTSEDPKVFKSMLPFYGVGSMENIQINDINFSKGGFQYNKDSFKDDKFVMDLYEQLVGDDVSSAEMGIPNIYDEFKYVYSKYYDVNCMAYSAVEKLLEEKERIINYCARTMQEALIVELEKREFKDKEYFESNFAEGFISNPTIVNTVGLYDDLSPWYLKSDSEALVILDQNSGNIKFATRDALVSYLVYSKSDGSIDMKFMNVFLLTFRSIFSSTAEMLLTIIDKYHSEPPEGLTYKEYTEWMEKKLIPIKKNVVKILNKFLKRYWTPVYWEPNLESILMEISNQIEIEKIDGSDQLCNCIRRLIRNCKKAILHDPKEALNCGKPLPAPSKSVRNLKLSNIAPAQYAQQITLLNHEIFCNISSFECLDKIWGKQKNCGFGGSENISKFIEHANFMTNYVSYKIVKQTDIKKRVKVINYFITVALHCQRLCNYATLTAILSGLYASPVHRLKKTWNGVSNESKEILRKLDHLMDSKKNFLDYRMCLKSIPEKVACVPFFGVYLSDLTFADTGNQDSSEKINFRKRVMIYDIIGEIEGFQKRTYANVLAKNNDIQTFILDSLKGVPDLDEQYQLSLQIEPRATSKTERKAKPLTTTKLWKNKSSIKLFG